MKCPKCDGSGTSTIPVALNPFTGAGGFYPECKNCHGTGEIEQTNDEWRKTCSAEEFAELLGNIANNAYFCAINGKTSTCYNRKHCTGYCNYGWEKWLKEKHEE